jgi:DNA-binding transcriptional LysR family regulator
MDGAVSFGTHRLAPALPEFLRPHPEVNVDLSVSDHIVDLVMPAWALSERPMHLVYPKDRYMTPKLRRFVEFMTPTRWTAGYRNGCAGCSARMMPPH